MKRQRPSWNETFMFKAAWAATRSSCLYLSTGAVIVKDKRVIAEGYNGAGPDLENCLDRGCRKDDYNIDFDDKGKSVCRGGHAETNAMKQVSRERLIGSEIYSTVRPCSGCAKEIQGNGLIRVFYSKEYDEADSLTFEIFKESKIEIEVRKFKVDLQKDFKMMKEVLSQRKR